MKPYPCFCGHREVQHEHYRAGLDCAATGCTCLDYRAATPLRLWLKKVQEKFTKR